MDSGQFGMLRDQQLRKGAEQAFPDADIMRALEEAQVQRQILLRDATMRSQLLGRLVCPSPFHGWIWCSGGGGNRHVSS